MKKRNLVLQTAVASAMFVMMGSASAVTSVATSAVTYANEQFLGTTAGAAVIAPDLNIVTGVAIPSGSTITILIELAGGIAGVAPGVGAANAATTGNVSSLSMAATVGGAAKITTSLGSTIAGSTTAAAGSGTSTSATANNANVIRIVLANTDSAIGIGGTLATITAATLNASGLSVVGATVTATATIFTGTVAAPVGSAVPSTPLLDTASTATVFARSAKGFTVSAATNPSAARIDLTATVPSTLFTVPAASGIETGSSSTIKIGTITFVDGTAKLVSAPATGYAIGTKSSSTTVATLTAPAGFFAPLGTTGTLTIRASNAVACAGSASTSASTTFTTAAAAAAATTLSTTALAFAAGVSPGTSADVCLTVNGTTAIVAGTPVLTAVVGAASTQDSADSLAAATNLLTLVSNGQTVDIRSYVPKSVVGYTSFIRMINTGSIAGVSVSGQYINADGSVGTAFPLTTLAAGGSITMSSTDIEAIMGAPVGGVTARPRLRLSAPTNGLSVQSQLSNNASGVFTDFNGAQ